MRTTLNIDSTLMNKVIHLTGIKEKTALVKMGLEALIARESARRLALLSGSDKKAVKVPRRRLRANAV